MASTDSPRILIVRLSALGDAILTLPLLCALREKFPGAHLAWLAEPVATQILAGHPCLDQLFTVRKGWLKRPSEIVSLRRQLKEAKFDIVFDVQGLTKSAAAGWLSGAPRRITFARGQARELAPNLATEHVTPQHTHVVHRYLELGRAVDIYAPSIEFRLPIDEQARYEVSAIRRELGRGGSFAVLNPGAGWFSKTWMPQRFAEVARRLKDKYQLPSLVTWGNEQEADWAEEIAQMSHGAAAVVPKLTLPQLKELYRGANLFVGCDTGPLHLAAAVDTPCVALFGVTPIELCRPLGPHQQVVQAYYQQLTSRERARAGNEAMRAISTSMVFDAIDSIFEPHAREAA
ncbi:glycosyltransferase family 9 protein [Blastopirellula retiformator]|uniref:Lipopolysaccharide heptosyltransferase 1 n=1 Tax=Blastopirellula retiformator TaxID=2527970 RepID=A0A5C5VMW0_9BACT|nr:glycosyltransferase family 9 protein [Blastopirellula retiformator]TWT39235.1 Lipopolysaccharide heptosyltransferase 1 [Blastopirellula retiformator]